jgi:hypothetical protein
MGFSCCFSFFSSPARRGEIAASAGDAPDTQEHTFPFAKNKPHLEQNGMTLTCVFQKMEGFRFSSRLASSYGYCDSTSLDVKTKEQLLSTPSVFWERFYGEVTRKKLKRT